MNEELEAKIRKIIEEESAVEAIREWDEQIGGIDLPPFNYRYDHVFEAAQIAKHLARRTSASYDVAVLGAWLHDLEGPRTWKNYNHHELEAKRAREYLLKEGLDPDTTERICDAILSHMSDEPLKNLENQIVWDADHMTKIGLTAAVRDIMNSVRFHPNLTMHGILGRLRKRQEMSRKIADSIYTEPGKKMADSRYQNLSNFIGLLEGELNLE